MNTKRAYGNGLAEITNVRLPPDLKFRVTTLARLNGISISDLVRLSLLAQLSKVEKGRFRLKGFSAN